jgi:hypothetical protein
MPNNREETLQKTRQICDAYDQSYYQYNISSQIAQIESVPIEDDVNFDSKHRHAATIWSQMRWLLWRNFANDFRQPLTKILVFQVLV